MQPLDEVYAFLKTDLFKYVVHLKMLDAFAPAMHWYGERDGVALLLPAKVHPYDARTYPDADWIVLLATGSAEVAARLVEKLPRQERLVFKLGDELSKTAVLGGFPAARRVTAFVSYTIQEGSFPLDPEVVIARELDERLLPCFGANGYTRPELEHDFSQGSISFSLFGEQPLSTCFVFKNYAQIWEIGGVYTDPAHRRQGLGKRVVAAAVRELLALGRIPRYQARESNTASRAVAERLGMQCFVTTEHYLYEPEVGQ